MHYAPRLILPPPLPPAARGPGRGARAGSGGVPGGARRGAGGGGDGEVKVMTNLPPTLPVLKPEQFVKGGGLDGKKRCLVEWRFALIGCFWDSPAARPADDAMREAIGGQSPVVFNDAPSTTPQMQADVWAKMAEKLGYARDGDLFRLATPEAAGR
jgi:hypothetical protein